ncbi:Uncharacterised protein [Mycobacteroides abscessus subsp. abscessus]|nr:Uncharacterised protein [Mycobacteroides abscessus subsp. abscessus]SIK44492.1 Uncharacterised protein [Mycobacteroides abscessus subsp. abscessus]
MGDGLQSGVGLSQQGVDIGGQRCVVGRYDVTVLELGAVAGAGDELDEQLADSCLTVHIGVDVGGNLGVRLQ